MKAIGIALMIVGVLWGLVAFNMKTSIETEARSFGTGEYSVHIPSQNVHNLDLADRRRDHLILAAVLFLSGSVLFGFGSMQKTNGQHTNNTERNTEAIRKCPYCAETVKAEARICKHCGKELSPIVVLGQTGKQELVVAVLDGNWALAKGLLESGAIDINATDSKGRTSLDIATARNDSLLVGELLKHGAKTSSELNA
jgi:hypothetical protein